jgi:SAM-dependent methyltransferase
MLIGVTDSLALSSHAEERHTARLSELVGGYQLSQIVACMAQLDIATHIADGQCSSGELAQLTGARPDSLRRFLRAAAGLGLLDEVGPDRFGLTSLGSWLRRSNGAPSMREFAIGLSGKALTRTFEHLIHAVMTGQPAVEAALGTSMYEYLGAHPEEARHFAEAMGEMSDGSARQIVAQYDVSSFRRIVDVGGSHGAVLRRLLEAAPRATGVLFDRPDVIARARRAFDGTDLAGRIEFAGGTFLEEVPGGGDLYVLREVLHNWDDARARRILENCHRVALPGSKLLVGEVVLPARADATSQLEFQLDLIALVAFGGKERTRAEYADLFSSAGYSLRDVQPVPSLSQPWSLLVADWES